MTDSSLDLPERHVALRLPARRGLAVWQPGRAVEARADKREHEET